VLTELKDTRVRVKNKGLKIEKSTSASRLVCATLLTLLMTKRLRGLRLTVNII